MLTGKIAADYIVPTYLAPPYDLIISKAKEGKTPAQILDTVGLMPVNAARQAAEVINFNETTLEELLSTLMAANRRQEQTKVLEEQVKLLKKGENLETDKISLLLEKTEEYKGKYIRLSEVDATTPVWRKSYYPPIDEHLGDPEDISMVGIPESGLVIIAGPTGCLVGETLVKYNRGGLTRTATLEHVYNGLHGIRNGNGRAWKKDIKTYLQCRMDDNTIRLNEVDAVVYSGEQEVYTLTLEDGKNITGTFDHPILTDRGWVGITDLTPESLVYVNVGRTNKGRTKPQYLQKQGLKYHPNARRVDLNMYTVTTHRLIVEASINNLELDEFVELCRTDPDVTKYLGFLPENMVVHHNDGDTFNNDLNNLQVMTVEAHSTLHSMETYRNVLERTGLVKVKSVIHVGIRPTYDVYMKEEPHNFLANDIVVHNTGKSSLMATIVSGMAAEKKTTLVYTLEMTTGQIAKRIIQVAVDGLSEEQKNTVIICNEIMSVDEVYADAMRLCATEDVYSIFIDFSDLLIEREQDEQSMAHVYRRCATLAKKNLSGAPVFLLSQLNRSVYTGTGGVPKINQLRWSGLAEAMGALILLIYNPNQIFATQTSDEKLPAIPGRAYVIVGKSRFGFREGSPGAIQVDFDGKTSWGRSSYGYFNLSSV